MTHWAQCSIAVTACNIIVDARHDFTRSSKSFQRTVPMIHGLQVVARHYHHLLLHLKATRDQVRRADTWLPAAAHSPSPCGRQRAPWGAHRNNSLMNHDRTCLLGLAVGAWAPAVRSFPRRLGDAHQRLRPAMVLIRHNLFSNVIDEDLIN